jgi:uncharacterized protein YndB with AHSA1/START domain
MKNEPVVIERIYNAPVKAVWEAITDKDKMKEWYFTLEKFKPEVGFEFRFTGGSKEKQYLHICRITEVIPSKKLTHTWQYDGYPGESLVTFELFEDAGKAKLRLTHAGLETFPVLKDFARESFAQGWTYIIGKSLLEYLEKK